MMKNRRWPRVISVFLCLAMICTLLPTLPVRAEDKTVCETNGHVYHWEYTVTPTCTETGRESATCEVCGTTVSRDAKPLGHDFGALHIWTPATETEVGAAHRICSRCESEEALYLPVYGIVVDHTARSRLTGDEALAYDALLPLIREIAAGQRTNTVIKIGGGNDADVSVTFMEKPADFNIDLLMNALQSDFPGELLWNSTYSNRFSYSQKDGILNYFIFRLRVDPAYQNGDEYTLDPNKLAPITEGKNTVQRIVDQYESESDAEKLSGYWTEILNMTAFAELPGDSKENISPWKLTSVFDGDPTTKTAAVGYADAFQYLCALGGLVSYRVNGRCNQTNHAWNIVALDGYNYLIDSANGSLFLAGGAETEDGKYLCTDPSGNAVSYETDNIFKQLWGSEVLTLFCCNYEDIHTCSVQTEASSCTEAHQMVYSCLECDYIFTVEGAALGHSWGQWYTVAEATEFEVGTEQRDCDRCGASENREIPKTDHVHQYIAMVTEPDCTNGGYTTYTCSCGDSYVDNEVSALGHDFGHWSQTNAPTCTEKGEEKRSCFRCDHSETRAVEATGHTYESVVTAPTCTEGGYTNYTCAACGDSYVADEVPALGHCYTDGTCTRCGEEDPNYEAPPEHVENPFTDVKDGDYFLEPVLWAVGNGITAGTGNGQFSPDAVCTRAQVVTFLWRAKGSPEPAAQVSPFEDAADPNAYFYKAVLWACENNITTGVSATRFAPNDVCTRGQVATFLHRTALIPTHTAENPFHDVDSSAYYYNAVLWAFENGITTGVSQTSFAPGQFCTRGQIVTFLYRARAFFEEGDMIETLIAGWDDYFEIIREESVADHSGRLVPNHKYYLTVKDGADWEDKNFQETLITYRYHVKVFYYQISENGEITLNPDGELKETVEKTVTVGHFPLLLAEKGVHGHTSAGRFLVYLPTDMEIVRVVKRVYREETLDHYITFEANGLIPDEMAEMIQSLIHEIYPLIFEYFAGGNYEKISCSIELRNGVAATNGRSIFVNADYLNANPVDLDCITHELVHCAQYYPSNPVGWLTEGIADYGRYLFGLYNEDAGWKLPGYSPNQSYTDGYRVAAAFLKYVVDHHEAEMVRILNTALQNGIYHEDLWKTHTGYTIDELWELYAKAG